MNLGRGQRKHKVSRKTFAIAPNCLIKRPGQHSIEFCEIAIEHHLFAANQVNSFFDSFDGDEICVAHVRSFREI